MLKIRKFFRASKGLEALQVVLIIAIACMVLLAVKSSGNTAAGNSATKVTEVMGAGGNSGSPAQ